MRFFGTNFFCEIKFNGCNSLSRHNMFLWFLVQPCRACTETVRDQSFFCFEEMDQSLPTTEDGTAGFLEILDSVWSAKAPSWMTLQMICKNAFNERCNLNCLMWTILLLFRKNEQKLPDSVVYLLVPGQLPRGLWAISFQLFYANIFIGLFSNHGPLYFVKTKAYFSKMGLACHIAKIHSEVLPLHT